MTALDHARADLDLMPVVLWACLVEALHDRYDLPRLYGAVLVDSGWLRWGVA